MVLNSIIPQPTRPRYVPGAQSMLVIKQWRALSDLPRAESMQSATGRTRTEPEGLLRARLLATTPRRTRPLAAAARADLARRVGKEARARRGRSLSGRNGARAAGRSLYGLGGARAAGRSLSGLD